MVAFRTATATWFALGFLLPLIAVFISACGNETAAVPRRVPTRQVFPTPGPGTPTLPNPRPALTATPTATVTPVIMKFNFKAVCQVGEEIRLRLFDETDNLIFLDNMHDFILTSSSPTPTPISIACRSGNNICYGGVSSVTTSRTPSGSPPPTPTPRASFGVGLNNDQQCDGCCFVCASVTPVPEIDLRCPLL
jgi:hypothetical protein